MKYNINKLARMYVEYLSNNDFDVIFGKEQTSNISTYNEYEYKKLMAQFDKLYHHTDSLNITEQFIKGD